MRISIREEDKLEQFVFTYSVFIAIPLSQTTFWNLAFYICKWWVPNHVRND